jgi:hypothetical protein
VKFRPPTQDDYDLLDEMAALGRSDARYDSQGGKLSAPEIGADQFPSFALSEPKIGDSASAASGFVGDHQLTPPTPPSAAAPTTDWGGVAGAGIGAAGQMVGTLAQVAGNKYAMDRQMEASGASRALSEKLAKMQIAASQEDYLREQNLRALLWALGANKGQQAISAGGREVRRGAIDGMDDLLAKVMLKRG